MPKTVETYGDTDDAMYDSCPRCGHKVGVTFKRGNERRARKAARQIDEALRRHVCAPRATA